MNLKTACKTAMIATIISFILIVLGQIFSLLTIFFQDAESHNGWSVTPATSNMSLFLMRLIPSFEYLLFPALLTAGFITLLSTYLEWLKNPEANTKKRYTIAAVLIGLVALLMAWRTVGFTWITLRQAPYLSFQYGLSLAWHLTETLSAITLCIFAAVSIKRTPRRTPALLATIFYCLLAALTIAGAGNTLHRLLTSDTLQHLGTTRMILWFASLVCGRCGIFLRLAAVLIFLTTWLKQNPPMQAGVIESSPDPLPNLSAQSPLPKHE
ncbi:MAG: hypothetical protein OEV87_12615 [Phycisphaerae bacterium]|nr:hypothetical protein [Phycisphaerae bacterium]